MIRTFTISVAGLLAIAAIAAPTTADKVPGKVIERFTLTGDLAYSDELSGVAFWQELLIACPDEGAEFNVLRPANDAFQLVNKISLLEDGDDEIDMEGAASDGDFVYVVGSHSLRRSKVKEKSPPEKNRKRLQKVRPHEESYSLYQVELDGSGQLRSSRSISLTDVIDGDPILQPYAEIPSKENGIDIEGIAVRDGQVTVGFRGPVLRGNFVPALSFPFERPGEYALKFVQLNGRGIRDLAAVQGGYLILAGPIGDGDASYQLYWWNGEDCLAGDSSPGRLTLLGEIPKEVDGAKPEGVAVRSEDSEAWRILLVSDGIATATMYSVAKP